MNPRQIAEKFVRDCLEIMDGSVEAGMERIGTERFEHTVLDVLEVLPQKPMTGIYDETRAETIRDAPTHE